MGLFDRLFGKKEKADWSKAVRSQPNLGEKLSLLSLAEGEETILPKEPQKEYTIDGQPSEEWKLVLMKRTRKGKCFGVGHADYASALEKLAPYILDQDKTSVLVRALTGEELETANEKWWAYWQEYWKRRESSSPLPRDYGCDVTIPAGRHRLGKERNKK